MPLLKCQRDGKPGYKWGEKGHCYLIDEEGGEAEAKKAALRQAVAIGGGKIENKQELLKLLKRKPKKK